MSFDLEKHLKNHAEHFKKFKEINPKSMHFNFSFLDLQFIGKDKKQVMHDLLEELKKPTSYYVANGWKNGKQVFANRAMDLSSSIEIEAIHFRDPENQDTMPHIHFMLKQNTRLGKNYSLLKKHISVISSKFGITPNFDEMTEHNPMSVKNLSKAVSSLTWSWKKMSNDELRRDISTRGINNAINILSAYAMKTNSLTYYVKSLKSLKTRLNRLKLDVEYQGHNLRNTYPLPLREEDLKVIKLIVEKKFNQKDMKPHLKNPILRDFIRYSAGTSKAYIITSLKEMTHLLDDGIHKNQRAVENYLKLVSKIPAQVKKSQLTKEQNIKLKSKSTLAIDLKLAAKSATNEKELRALMQEAGYQGFGLKKLKGSVIGCFHVVDEKKRVFKFADININWSEIKYELMLKTMQNEINKELLTDDLSPLSPLSHPMPLEKTPKAVQIDYKHEEVEKNKNKNRNKSKLRRIGDELMQKFRNGIQKFKNGIQRIKRKITQFEERIKSKNDSILNSKYKISDYEEQIRRDEFRGGEFRVQLRPYAESRTTRITRNRELRKEIKELETIATIHKYGENRINIMQELIAEAKRNDELDKLLRTYFSLERHKPLTFELLHQTELDIKYFLSRTDSYAFQKLDKLLTKEQKDIKVASIQSKYAENKPKKKKPIPVQSQPFAP